VTADSQEFVRAVCVARTVERGKNPEDGTGEGLATFTHPAAVERSWWGDKGHPASLCSREQEPTRGESRARAGNGRLLTRTVEARGSTGSRTTDRL
jgi:hypothetical protein